jgi:hypothetical protein
MSRTFRASVSVLLSSEAPPLAVVSPERGSCGLWPYGPTHSSIQHPQHPLASSLPVVGSSVGASLGAVVGYTVGACHGSHTPG